MTLSPSTEARSPMSETETKGAEKIVAGLNEAVLHAKLMSVIQPAITNLCFDGNVGETNSMGIASKLASDCLSVFHQTGLTPEQLKQENARLREALEDVVNPLGALQRKAAAEGNRLNAAAVYIANDIAHVQSIARSALAPQSGGTRR